MVTTPTTRRPPAKATATKAAAATKKATTARKAAAARAARAPVGSVTDAVNKLLATIELDEGARANASIALVLACKLDEARYSDAGPVAMAVSGIAKELRATLDAILEVNDDAQEFVEGLFA